MTADLTECLLCFQLTIQRSRHGYGFVVSGSSPVQVSQVHTGLY